MFEYNSVTVLLLLLLLLLRLITMIVLVDNHDVVVSAGAVEYRKRSVPVERSGVDMSLRTKPVQRCRRVMNPVHGTTVAIWCWTACCRH